MHSDKNPRNLRFLVECKRLQQARRRLVAGVDARQKCMLLDASCVASTVVSSKVCLRFVACVIIYIYIYTDCFSGLRFESGVLWKRFSA